MFKFFNKVILMAFLSLIVVGKAYSQINAEQVLTIGRNVLSMDDYMLAIQYFNQAIKAKPYLADPYYYRALAKLYLEDYAGAENDCSSAIEINKFKIDAYKLRGFARQVLGKDSLAVEDFNVGLEYNPTDRNFLFYKAVALTDMGRYDAADSTFTDLFRQHPKEDEAYSARARMNMLRGDTVAALSDIDMTLALSKTDVNPYLMKAEIAWNRKDWETASSALDAVVRLKPDLPDLYINRAYVRYNTGDFFGAMSDYNYAIELEPDNSASYFNRGLLRYEVKDLPNAEKDMSNVIRLDPGNFHAYLNRGLIRLERGRNQDALSDFKVIAKRYPRYYPIYYAMAEAERKMGNTTQAIMYIHEADVLIEKYVTNPKKNPLDRPAIAAAKSKTENKSGKKTTETEEDVMDQFNSLVTISQVNENRLSYNEQIKGRVQDRDVTVEMEPAYALSLYPPQESLKSVSNYFKELDDLNRQRLVNQKLYLTPGLSSTSYNDKMQELFDLASSLEAKNGSRPVDKVLKGVVATMLKNYPEALASLDEAIEMNPGLSVAYMARGYARYANALSDIKLSQEEQDKDNAFMERTVYTALLQDALKDFDKVLELNPRLVYAWFNKGNIYYEAHDFTSAMQCYSEAIKIDPEFGEAYFNRGLSYLNSGNKTQAFSDLSKAGELGVLPSYNILKRMK